MNDDAAKSLFLKFHYNEVKDLAKQFLTLIAGTLVLSVSFADKILPVDKATDGQRLMLGLCWLCLLTSLVLAGLGVFMNYLAAEQAHGAIIYDYGRDFRRLVRRSYAAMDLAAITYALALVLLATTGGTRYFV